MGCSSTPKVSGNIKKVPTTIENVEIVNQGQKEEKKENNLKIENQKSFKKEKKNANFIVIVGEEKRLKEIKEEDKRLKETVGEEKRLKEIKEEDKRLIEEDEEEEEDEEKKKED